MPSITIMNETRSFSPGTQAGEICKAFNPSPKLPPVGVNLNGRVRPLNWAPDSDCTLQILDYSHESGRRIYERSLRFLFLLATHDILPGTRVRIEHSAGYGLFINVQADLTEDIVSAIEKRMKELRDAALPFVRKQWPLQAAIAHFKERGEMDKVHLLSYRPLDTIDLYCCNGYNEYFYGDMLPSTDHVHTFALVHHHPGIVLQMPLPTAPFTVAPFAKRPKLMRAFAEAAHWLDILECQNVSDLNEMMRNDRLKEFVRVNEALQEKSIAHIADRIVQRGAKVVFIAGPSSSGKTTFTNRLAIQLRVNGLKAIMLSLDNYYRNLSDIPLDENGIPDLESLDALDTPLLGDHLRALVEGNMVEVPHFSFKTNCRAPKGTLLQVAHDQPILIEGIHGLNPSLTQEIPRDLSYQIYISALTALNLDDHNRIRTTDMRLLRRLVRDKQFRNAPFEETFSMWPSVRRGEEKYIFPYQEEADIMFNSALSYEPAVLRKYAYDELNAFREDHPHFSMARMLVKFLNYFLPADIEYELGPTSILREFIGGCSFYLKSK